VTKWAKMKKKQAPDSLKRPQKSKYGLGVRSAATENLLDIRGRGVRVDDKKKKKRFKVPQTILRTGRSQKKNQQQTVEEEEINGGGKRRTSGGVIRELETRQQDGG